MSSSLKKIISESRILLQNPYAYLNENGDYDAEIRCSDHILKDYVISSPKKLKSKILRNNQKDFRISNIEIERSVNKLLNDMWTHRKQIWHGNIPNDPMEIRDPSVALRFIGYESNLTESLGQFSKNGKIIEVAGIIDNSTKQVKISRQFEPVIRNFTTAHELGHALLHKANGLHRDRPLDGTNVSGSREIIEIEADKFASYFLMPKKIQTNIRNINFFIK
jgi:hypothetical protein